LNQWTLLLVATHVNRLALQANDKETKMSDTYGLTSFEPLASYDHDTHSWKMYAVISLWDLTESLETLPKSGMTRNGKLFQQPALAPLIDATALSVWPTPRSNTAMAATITPESAWNPKRFPNLETVVGQRMWPTPTTQEVEHPNAELTATGRRKAKNGNSHSMGLADSVRMWPTPTAVTRPMEGNVRMYIAKIEAGEMTEAEAEAILGKSVWEAQGKLPMMWPTPQARDYKGASGRSLKGTERDLPMAVGNGGRLNPTWVEWLMGFPLGWTDLEDLETL
jgi:hypothetical protein